MVTIEIQMDLFRSFLTMYLGGEVKVRPTGKTARVLSRMETLPEGRYIQHAAIFFEDFEKLPVELA